MSGALFGFGWALLGVAAAWSLVYFIEMPSIQRRTSLKQILIGKIVVSLLVVIGGAALGAAWPEVIG